MGFLKGTCPNCKGELQIPEELDKVICMYCGGEILKCDALNQNKEILNDPEYLNEIKETKEKFSKTLFELNDPMKNFNKKEYKSEFQKFYSQNEKTLVKIEQLYQKSPVKDQLLKEFADTFLEAVKDALAKQKSKRKADDALLDYNMILAVYLFPAILELEGSSSQPLAQTVLDCWKENFPKTNLALSSFENINEGFNKKFCYITTAVCESLGKTDDCYELTLLRNYRDLYLQKQPNGEEVIKKYYDIAPTIVKHINKHPDNKIIYKKVWEDYLYPCIQCIELDQNKKCMKIYTDMVEILEKKYFM
ncbi:CFI-box-CTERM domain-containing protein [Anaerosacchariphilus polymeriproducens]|uniref:Uncharacterized protein n=1 Tax=Anaerosacchariphilus polymeriproducens TaxID=1812858 RepID=A0A371ATZ2_9FIRM|nr:CFI-box-CTERM domain-containing protein [Anaerosacchariphilus polymeriproducens]RDU23012.1 hypothetical protein DWV06_11640 [Anaerosacchariphilus polymeriproducens]